MRNGPNESDSASTMKCPLCGAKMVIRLATKGKSKGRYFWGCSAYPHCKETVPAKLEHLPQRELRAVGYITCPQCAGSGTDIRTPLFRWLFSGKTGLKPDLLFLFRFVTVGANDASLSKTIEQLSLHKSCELCLGTGLCSLPTVEAARRSLTMEAKVFEDARKAYQKNAQDSEDNEDQIRTARDARKRYLESESDAHDYLLLTDETIRSQHFDKIRNRFGDSAEQLAALAAEEDRLRILDNDVRREELRKIAEQRMKDLTFANQEYELDIKKKSLEEAMPGMLASMVDSAYRAGSIRILLGIALKKAADEVNRERARTGPKVADDTAGRIEDEPSEIDSEEDLALDEYNPFDGRELSPSLELLAPEDPDSEDWVEVMFSHASDGPNFGEPDHSIDDGEGD
jgi:ssDNA-binding Zn-finger/Zn-ribbon topoisomerase 1